MSPAAKEQNLVEQVPLYIGIALAALVVLLVVLFVVICLATRRKRQGSAYSATTTGEGIITSALTDTLRSLRSGISIDVDWWTSSCLVDKFLLLMVVLHAAVDWLIDGAM